jgi:hypothetical protein
MRQYTIHFPYNGFYKTTLQKGQDKTNSKMPHYKQFELAYLAKYKK